MIIHFEGATGERRKEMVKAISEATNGRISYKGAPSFDYEAGSFLIHKDGNVETDDFADPKALGLLLHTLRARGYRLAVCSSADRVKVLMNLSAIGAEESLFDQLVTGTDIKNPKPDPEIYLTGAASLGLAPSECIVVEDAPSGIRAAHAAGIEAIGLATSFPADYLREQAQPEYLLPDLKSILTLL